MKVCVEFPRLTVMRLGMPDSSSLSSYVLLLLQLMWSSVIVWAVGLPAVAETSSSSPGVCCSFLLELLFEAFNLSEVEKDKIKLGRKKFCTCN